MMNDRDFSLGVFVVLLMSMVSMATSIHAAEAPFYEGKTLRILIASGPGGGTDTAGRLTARYLPKYLPGNPKIIVQNMGGGGGTIANNYFASEVKPDGLTIMQDSSSSVANFVRGGSSVKYDPRKFRLIGGVRLPGVSVIDQNDARERLTNKAAKPAGGGGTGGIRKLIAMTGLGA